MALRPNAIYLSGLIFLETALWLPRLRGPLDLRYDAGVYYILGTSLAQGQGYRLLNEPGAIEALQYPPLLPFFAAGHQLLVGSTDPAVVGHWLRLSFFVLCLVFIVAVYGLSRRYLSPGFACLATLVTLLHVYTTWLSDLFFAELPFALMSVLFLLVAGWRAGPGREWLTGMLGVAFFLLRSSGITLLAAWVGESLLRRRWRQMAFRAVLALFPVLVWQGYIAHVKGSATYAHPAYEYQRASYQYYNVGYLQNLTLIDPFAPELGTVSPTFLAKRIARNLALMPANWGEAVSVRKEWAILGIERINREFPSVWVPLWPVDVVCNLLGVMVLVGLAMLLLKGTWLIPLYVAGATVLTCLTPWPGQFERYLMPLTPLLALALFVSLAAVRKRLSTIRRLRVMGTTLIIVVAIGIFGLEAILLYKVYTEERTQAFYTDARGQRRAYPLFFYTPAWRQHDAALDWLKENARPGEIVATSTPHWAYLKTDLPAVLPPFELDVQEAQRLIDTLPVSYLIVDSLEFLDIIRRYAMPMVREFPECWELIYSTPDSGSRIYRRVVEGGTQKPRESSLGATEVVSGS